MADQNLTGVTTRPLDTAVDTKRATAISRRSQLAEQYTAQFRDDRNSFRRGGVIRSTTGPSVPAAQGDVTQTQDTSVPGSFQDVLDATSGIRGDSQSANQAINPGMNGGSSGGSSVNGGSGSGSQRSGSSSSGAADASCPSGWSDSNGKCTDPPQDVGCITLPDGRTIGDCGSGEGAGSGEQDRGSPGSSDRIAWLDSTGIRTEVTNKPNGGKHYKLYSKNSNTLYSTFNVRPDGSLDTYKAWLMHSPSQGYNKIYGS